MTRFDLLEPLPDRAAAVLAMLAVLQERALKE